MSSPGNSHSPFLLSLKQFRFKKKNSLNDAEEDHSSDCNILDNGSSPTINKEKNDESSDDEKELVIIRKKKKLKVEDSEDRSIQGISKQSDSDSDGSEAENYQKFKRLKFHSGNSLYSSEKNKTEKNFMLTVKERSKVQKDMKFFFSGKGCVDKNSETSFNGHLKPEPSGTSRSSSSCSSHNSNRSKIEDSVKTDNDESNDCSRESRPSSSSSNNIPEDNEEQEVKKEKKKRRRSSESDGEIYNEGNVYDSDQSDNEITDELTGMKMKVLEFLNTASEDELKEIRCSQKKITAIMTVRPFSGWRDLVHTCEDNKSIGTDVLNATQSLLSSRRVLSDLMRRCEKIAKRTEKAIAEGATNITKEPSILSPGFQLKSYQMVGLNWLAVMHSQKLSGILADEMGLGKTIQVIAFLAYLKESGFSIENCPHLVVVPASTLDNWCNEFERWCPSLKIGKYYGNQDERRQIRYNWIKHGFDGIEVILSTYQVISGAYEDKKMFRVTNLHYAIFDEGHMLKNMNTIRYESLFKVNSKHKLLLTGTPVQNNLLELMSLLMFVMPKMFATKKDFIKYLFEKKTNATQDQMKFEREKVENAKRIMKPFMLRRLKDDVLLDLPTKTSEIVVCPMVESQAVKYNKLLDQFKISAADKSNKISFLAMYTDLRRVANHPLTLRYIFEDDKLSEMSNLLSNDFNYKENDVDKIFEDLSYMSDHELHKLTQTFKCLKKFALPDSVFLESGKFVKLDELLPDLKANNHRLLIFSQYIFILDILEEYLRIREHSYLRIDGSTPVLERQHLIDLYNMNTQIFVFLLTTKAGGVGINLTSADTVIINDVDFNPYNDKQAEDRCHRMGQTRDVRIIRFISKDTVEEKIFQVAQDKTNLGQEVTADDEAEEQKNMVSLLHSALGL